MLTNQLQVHRFEFMDRAVTRLRLSNWPDTEAIQIYVQLLSNQETQRLLLQPEQLNSNYEGPYWSNR